MYLITGQIYVPNHSLTQQKYVYCEVRGESLKEIASFHVAVLY
jgi:hypothetical protein